MLSMVIVMVMLLMMMMMFGSHAIKPGKCLLHQLQLGTHKQMRFSCLANQG